MYGTFKNAELEILRFYSNKHHAIFTHHTTNMQVHIKSDKVTGHADSFTLGEKHDIKIT